MFIYLSIVFLSISIMLLAIGQWYCIKTQKQHAKAIEMLMDAINNIEERPYFKEIE